MTSDDTGPPQAVPYRGVDQTWAMSVAEHLIWAYHSLQDPSMIIEDCWITTESALYVRHLRGDVKLGVRFGRLGINPTTETPPTDSAQEGVYLYHSIYDTPPEMKLTDQLGYDWWGDDPVGTDWASAIHHQRELTFLVHG